MNRVRLGADFGVSPVRVLDAPDGEAGVLHRPRVAARCARPHARENVHECFSPVGEHQLPTLVLSVRVPNPARDGVASGD